MVAVGGELSGNATLSDYDEHLTQCVRKNGAEKTENRGEGLSRLITYTRVNLAAGSPSRTTE